MLDFAIIHWPGTGHFSLKVFFLHQCLVLLNTIVLIILVLKKSDLYIYFISLLLLCKVCLCSYIIMVYQLSECRRKLCDRITSFTIYKIIELSHCQHFWICIYSKVCRSICRSFCQYIYILSMCRCIDLFIDESDTLIFWSIHILDKYDRRRCLIFSTQTLVETSELFDQHLL